MKRKEKQALAEKNSQELVKEAQEFREKIHALTVSGYSAQPKNLRERKILRNKLAVTLTILNQKEQ